MKRFKKYNKIDRRTTLDQEDYMFTELLSLVWEKVFSPRAEPKDFLTRELICENCGAQGNFYFKESVIQFGSFGYVDEEGEIHNTDVTDTDYSGLTEVYCNNCSDRINILTSFEETLDQWRIQYAKVAKAFNF